VNPESEEKGSDEESDEESDDYLKTPTRPLLWGALVMSALVWLVFIWYLTWVKYLSRSPNFEKHSGGGKSMVMPFYSAERNAALLKIILSPLRFWTAEVAWREGCRDMSLHYWRKQAAAKGTQLSNFKQAAKNWSAQVGNHHRDRFTVGTGNRWVFPTKRYFPRAGNRLAQRFYRQQHETIHRQNRDFRPVAGW
jgi:hypothetical protein